MPDLRFEFRVLNEDDEELASDYTTFTPGSIDSFGGCEIVDMHVSSALRFVSKIARRKEIAA